MIDNKYVLAMYDIRSKQAFIYRSNSIKEIAGGSLIIRDCFKDYLLNPEANSTHSKGIYTYESGEEFSRVEFEQRIREGYLGEVVYDGGGNFFVLYRDAETYRDINYRFGKRLLEEVGTLQVLPTYIEGVDFDNYPQDRKKLYDQHRIEEGKQSFLAPVETIPIVQVDYGTSEPLVDFDYYHDKVTKENLAKLTKFNKAEKDDDPWLHEIVFDKMVQEKGKESLLAVIYADGNNMGAKVEKITNGKHKYEDCINALRKYSDTIQKDYIDERKKDIDKVLYEKFSEKKKRRYVIGSGDEITFICNARQAYDIMKVYLEGLPEEHSACIGAAIFHSHAPYSEAYRIAEECCESGKQYMKENGIDGEACYMDFHYCQGAIGVSLEVIREEEVGELISKPWLVNKKGTCEKSIRLGTIDLELVENCKKALNNIGRSNVKGLASAARRGDVEFILELKRIRAHMKEEDRKKVDWDLFSKESSRALIYDMVIVFDIWFDEKEDREAGGK